MEAHLGFGAQNRLEYERDGYTVVRQAFSPLAVRAMRERYEQMIAEWDLAKLQAESQPFSTTDQARRTSDEYFLTSGDKIVPLFEQPEPHPPVVNKIGHALHELDPLFRSVAHSRTVLSSLRALGYQAPTCVQSMIICKSALAGGEVTAHQDNTFLISNPFTICGMWVALKPATVENGCMYFVPGSHLTQPVERLFVRGEEGGTRFEPEGGELVYSGLDRARPCTANEGDLVLFHGSVVHFSGPNRSALPRPAFTMHFYDSSVAVWDERNWLVSRFNPWPLYGNQLGGLPVVDLGGGLDAERAWDLAMSRFGACYVVGHGVDPGVVARLRLAMANWFGLPQSVKDAMAPKAGKYGSGTGYNSVGREAVSDGKRTDHVESFVFAGNGDVMARQELAELNAAAAAYKREVDGKLFLRTLRLAGAALGAGDALERLHTERPAYKTLKVSHYPPDTEASVLYGAHVDWEGFTYLLTDLGDDEGNGLQVLLEDGRWLPVPHVDGAFVCNCGDFVPKWTRDRWKSPIHRVVRGSSSSKSRYSIPYFTGPSQTQVIQPVVPNYFDQPEPEPAQAGDLFTQKLQAARL